MPSTPSELLGIELQATGEKLNQWGIDLNNNALKLLTEAIAKVQPLALAGNRTLTNTNYVSNEARSAALVLTDGGLSSAPTITIPASQKLYYVDNRITGYGVTFTCGGATASLPAGRKGFVLCDGTNVFVFDPVALAETAQFAAEDARDLAEQWASQLVALVDGDYSAKEYAVGVTTPLGSSKSWANKTGSAVVSTDYSAKEQAIGTAVPTGSALQWATKTGSAVASSEFSAKEYAQGTAATGGTSKQWAQVTGSAVAGGEYAAKEYAIGDLIATGGSAKAWAVDASSPNGTTDKSAKTLAAEAAASTDLAAKWAANPQDVLVSGGLYSALHYAAKAAISAAAAATFDPATYYSKTASDARFVPLTTSTSRTGAIFDTVVDKGTVSSGTVTFDVSASVKQRLQVGGALTVALSGKPTTAWELEILLVNGGAFTVTWPTTSWLKGDGTVSATFADMGVTLASSGTNTVILWGVGSGTVYGRAG